MNIELERFNFNWVNDFIDDDDDGHDHGGRQSSTNPHSPSLHLFSGHHTPNSVAMLPPPFSPADELMKSTLGTFKERIGNALRRYFMFPGERRALVQVWAPVKNRGHCVLTTSAQPFVIDPQSPSLFNYRTVSVGYRFAAMEDGEVRPELGLPGRVFRQRSPEWTPNVQFYRSEEYPRLSHALLCDVQGSVALPIFEPSERSCIGVIEIIMTSMKINYAQEIDAVCRALEAVNLKSSEIVDAPQMQICNEGRQYAFAEILEIITVVCETHKLPLAQAWVPCRHHNLVAHDDGLKEIHSDSDGSISGQVCITTTDAAFYVVDAHMWGFRDACAEHHLQEGQGVPSRALATRAACFSPDITQFSKTEYPLVHYARVFGLGGSLAIYLKSEYTGDDDYILEFFLTPSCNDIEEQRSLLESLLATINQCCRNLHIVIDYELAIENIIPLMKPSSRIVYEGITDEDEIVHFQMPQADAEATVCCDSRDVQQGMEDDIFLSVENLFQNASPDHLIPEDVVKDTCGNNGRFSRSVNSSVKKTSSRKGKPEKSVGLEVLQQYFAGSLKEAAKRLGVCPTTMKRICRQHGIARWPSRKIKKVNHSISKLQRVIESVPVAQGAFNLDSLKSQSHSPVVWGFHGKEHETNLTMVQPDKLESSNEGESLLEGNEALETRIAESEKPEKMMTSDHDHSTQPIPLVHVRSNARSINTVTSDGSNHDSSENIEASKLVTNCHISSHGGDHEEVHFNSSIRLGSSPSGEPCPDTAGVSNSFSRNKDCQELALVKATYKEDVVRFRVASSSLCLTKLKEEIAKRLKLKVGTYDVKYLDDEQEWVLLACEDDLKECISISKSCGRHAIRLLVNDIMPYLGSSCQSSGVFFARP